jgi:hypothetical protein
MRLEALLAILLPHVETPAYPTLGGYETHVRRRLFGGVFSHFWLKHTDKRSQTGPLSEQVLRMPTSGRDADVGREKVGERGKRATSETLAANRRICAVLLFLH